MPRPNPIRNDPTRLHTVRRSFLAEVRRKSASLKKEIWDAVVVKDALGLDAKPQTLANLELSRKVGYKFSLNVERQAWRFQTDAQKLKSFRDWIEAQVEAKLLSPVGEAAPWANTYIESAYRKGIVRSYVDIKKAGALDDSGFYAGGQAQFLESAFAQPTMVSKLELLHTRAFQNLKGITQTMASSMNQVMSNAIANGYGARKTAKLLRERVDSLTKSRANTIARTELTYAHSEGQLDSLELLGVEETGVMAEWRTAGDNRVCPLCSALEGVVMKVKEARGLIPRHPNCRCAFIPAFHDIDDGEQVKTKKGIQSRIRKSIRKEKPKATYKAAKEGSTWAGKEVRIGKDRENPT